MSKQQHSSQCSAAALSAELALLVSRNDVAPQHALDSLPRHDATVHATVHITSTIKRLQSRAAVTESIETLLRGVDAKPTAYCCDSSKTCEEPPYATLRDTIDKLLCIQQSCTYTTYHCYFVVQVFKLASSQTRAARTDATRNACASGSN
eukprot:4673-Heterococcus_DN1.PRE.3